MTPRKTRLTFNVGITGHRNIDSAKKPALTDLSKTILRFVSDTVIRIYKQGDHLFSNEPPKLRLLSSLAEGFDRIAAFASIDLGYEIQCVLPFSREEYEKDFETADSKDEFESLLHKTGSVFELELGRDLWEKPYLNAGTIMIEHTDLLLAFWDGNPAKGPGGTADVVELAKEKDIPVVWITPNMEVTYNGDSCWEERVKAFIESILIPYGKVSNQNTFPWLYFNENVEQKSRAWLYNTIIQTFTPKAPKQGNILQANLKEESIRKSKERKDIKQYCKQYFDEADRLAIYYGDYYRSAGILRALIPLFANIALAVGFYWRWGDNPNLINIFGFLSQAVLLYWMVRLVGEKNEKNKWHQKFIDYRILAECLRYQPYVTTLGMTLRDIEITAYHKNDSISWINWYLKSIVREMGLPNMLLDKQFLREELNGFAKESLLGQVTFYGKSAEKHKAVGQRLEKTGVALFTVGAGITVIRVFVHFACQVDPGLVWFPSSSHKIIKVPTFINMLSLLLPAFGTAMFTIGTQVGFDRLSQRYEYMRDQLAYICQEVKEVEGKTLLGIRKWAFGVVEMLINEVADWRMFIKGKSISKR